MLVFFLAQGFDTGLIDGILPSETEIFIQIVYRAVVQRQSFLTFKEPRNRFQGTDSASLCRVHKNEHKTFDVLFAVPGLRPAVEIV